MNRVLLICVVLVAAACGTRGPLFLPPDAGAPSAPKSVPDHTKVTPPVSPK